MSNELKVITSDLPSNLDSKYRMIIIAALRSKQLQKGATPRITDVDTSKHKNTRIALEEVRNGKVDFTFTDNSAEEETVS